MDAIEYRAEILSAYLGERAGAVTAAALAERPDFTPADRDKVQALERLERHVASVLEPVMRRHDLEQFPAAMNRM